MLCAYLLVFHTAREDDGTDSAMRRCVYNPATASQPATMPRVAPCKQGQDATGTHSATNVFRVVSPITQHGVRATARRARAL
jgi:hypothetical protein